MTQRSRLSFVLACILIGMMSSLASAQTEIPPKEKWEGLVNVAATGGTFLDNLQDQNENDLIPGDDQGDTLKTQSEAFLYGIPEGVNVLKAYLVWMGSLNHGADPTFTGCQLSAAIDQPSTKNTVILTPPGGNQYTVEGQASDLETVLYQDTYYDENMNEVEGCMFFYTYRVDVTDILQRHNTQDARPLIGTYKVQNVYAYTGNPYYSRTTVLAGWSLFIVYASPDQAPKKIYYYTKFNNIWDSSYTMIPSGFEVPGEARAKITFFIGEGDQGISGPCINIACDNGTTQEGIYFNDSVLSDICNPLQNAYNSTVNTGLADAEGACRTDQYSIDLDTFDVSPLVSLGDTSANIRWETGQDQIYTNYLLLSIDSKLPDFDIPGEDEKLSDPACGEPLTPGQEYTYTIAIENHGDDVATDVSVRDRLSRFVTYVPNSTVLKRPTGEETAIMDPGEGLAPIEQGIDIADTIRNQGAERYEVSFKVVLSTLEEGLTKESIIDNVAEIISNGGDIYFTNGGSPCRHTVQVESYEGTLHFEAVNTGYRFVSSGDEDVSLGGLKLSATVDDVALSSFALTPVIDSHSDMVDGEVSLYLDNGNGAFDDEDDKLTSGVWSSGVMLSNLGDVVVEAGESILVWFVADTLADDLENGDWFQVKLEENSAAIRGFRNGRFPIEFAKLSVPNESLTVEAGEANPVGGDLTPGESTPVLQLKLSSWGEDNTVSGLVLTPDGTFYDPTEITGVTVYRDKNKDGLVDDDDKKLGEGVFAGDNQALEITGLDLSIEDGKSRYVLVVVDVASDVSEGKNFMLGLMENNHVQADHTAEGAPVEGAVFAVPIEEQTPGTADGDNTNNPGGGGLWTADDDDDDEGSEEDGGGGGCSQTTPIGFLTFLLIGLASLRMRSQWA